MNKKSDKKTCFSDEYEASNGTSADIEGMDSNEEETGYQVQVERDKYSSSKPYETVFRAKLIHDKD